MYIISDVKIKNYIDLLVANISPDTKNISKLN
jgi:hypothetical protein